MAFEVCRPFESVASREQREWLRAERGAHLWRLPHVVAAFLAGRVGIEAGVERAARRAHLGQQPVGGACRHLRVQRLAGGTGRLGIDAQQRGVVVQHFFKVRDSPFSVDAVAVKAAAQLVEQTALGHARQRQRRHVQRLQVGHRRCGAGVPVAQQALQQRRVRKFRRTSEAAPVAIQTGFELRTALVQGLRVECLVSGHRRRIHVSERRNHRAGAAEQLGLVIAIVVGDMREQLAEARHAMTAHGWEIGARKKRPLIVMHQEYRQRPAAAAAAEHLLRELVQAIEVGTFLAIDLDIDEALVHQRRSGRILEGLVRHHVAPVAGGIADREQNGLVLATRQRQRRIAPGIPVHRVVRVLAQIRAGLARQTVAVTARYIGHGVCPSH